MNYECILCGCELTDEEIDLGFDVCESCEDDESSYGGYAVPQHTKMRMEKDKFQKAQHRPRGLDKFDSIDTREIPNDEE